MIFRAIALTIMPMAAMAQDCSQAMTQMEMNQCAADDLKRADAGLNKAWTAAMGRMHQIDEGMAQDQRGAAQALREAQRAWIILRDKGCEAASWVNYGGSIRPLVDLNCKTVATDRRTADLLELAASQK